MLLEGRRVGAAAGALSGRPSSASLGRPPARASGPDSGRGPGPGQERMQELGPTEEVQSTAFFRHFHKISHSLGCYRITVSTRTSLITSISKLLTV